jgi:cytoskeletal protein CcmA (bactofilin family)
MKTKSAIVLGIVLCINVTLQAMVIHNYRCEKGEAVKTESGIFNGDYLFLGRELTFSGEAEDLVFLGMDLTFDGKTKLGLIAFCENLIYSGMSGNGIITVAKDVVINGRITGNSYIGCKSITISDKAIVDGTLFVGCAKIIINGALSGDLYVYGSEIVINSEIHGNVTARGGRIIIGDKGKINGNLNYSTKETLSDKYLTKVTGTVTINKNDKCDTGWRSLSKTKKQSIGFLIGFGMFLSYLFVGYLLLFIPAFKKLDAKQSEKSFWMTALWGLVPMLMYPAIIILSIILIITIPFAIVLLFAIIPLFFIASIIGTTLIGKYLVTKFKWIIDSRHYQFLIGGLAVAVICLIPYINSLVMIFTSALGWGVYLSFLFNKDFFNNAE